MRLAGDPTRTDGTYTPFGWGFEFDLDGNPSSYEILTLLDGIGSPASSTSRWSTCSARRWRASRDGRAPT
jgi:hypothetical protein